MILVMAAIEARIMSEDIREWMILKNEAELRKLQIKLAEDEGFERSMETRRP